MPAVPLHVHTKTAHGGQRNLDIGFGDQFAHYLDSNRPVKQRQGHEEAGQELARYIAFNRHGEGTVIALVCLCQRARLNLQRRITRIAQVGDIGTKVTEPIHQIANWTLVHARYARQLV